MDIAPFGDFQVAPEGVTLDQFDEFVEETRQRIRNLYPDLEVDHAAFVGILKMRAATELEMLRAAGCLDEAAATQAIESEGVINNEEVINRSLEFGVQSQDWQKAENVERAEGELVKRRRVDNPMFALESDLFAMEVCDCPADRVLQQTELAVQIGSYLEPSDILNLFCVSKAFNASISANITSSIRMWIRNHGQESGEIFSFRLYRSLCIPDPAGRTNAFHARRPNATDPTQDLVRDVPSLRWYQMVIIREKCVNGIVDELNARGHSLPRETEATLKKVWLLMDVATTDGRRQMLQNKALWTIHDLFNWQMFWVKLNACLGDPLWPPPGIDMLAQLMMGQRSLIKLWQMLTGEAFTTHAEYRQLKVRYSYMPSQQEFRSAMFGGEVHGVEAKEVGTIHLEGWGRGTGHLARPDELIPAEAARRDIQLSKHVVYQVLWGYHENGSRYHDFSSSPRYDFGDRFSTDSDDSDDSDLESVTPTEWPDLSHYEKAALLLQNLDGQSWLESRHYLQEIQTKTLERRAEGETAQDGKSRGDDHPLDDDVDLSALPDPNDPKNRRKTSNPIAAAMLRAQIRGDAPITPAIEAAIAQANADRGLDVDMFSYVNARLFGMTGVPSSLHNMNRGLQAWNDYEMEDYEPEWREYVDEINMPDFTEELDEGPDSSMEFFEDDDSRCAVASGGE